MQRRLFLALALFMLSSPALSQSIERTNDANLLMRAASFGSDVGTDTVYSLMEAPPGRWVAYAQRGQASSDTWVVTASPMSGPKAGYVIFTNGKKENLILDVLVIDTCYGITGEVRVGW